MKLKAETVVITAMQRWPEKHQRQERDRDGLPSPEKHPPLLMLCFRISSFRNPSITPCHRLNFPAYVVPSYYGPRNTGTSAQLWLINADDTLYIIHTSFAGSGCNQQPTGGGKRLPG